MHFLFAIRASDSFRAWSDLREFACFDRSDYGEYFFRRSLIFVHNRMKSSGVERGFPGFQSDIEEECNACRLCHTTYIQC